MPTKYANTFIIGKYKIKIETSYFDWIYLFFCKNLGLIQANVIQLYFSFLNTIDDYWSKIPLAYIISFLGIASFLFSVGYPKLNDVNPNFKVKWSRNCQLLDNEENKYIFLIYDIMFTHIWSMVADKSVCTFLSKCDFHTTDWQLSSYFVLK